MMCSPHPSVRTPWSAARLIYGTQIHLLRHNGMWSQRTHIVKIGCLVFVDIFSYFKYRSCRRLQKLHTRAPLVHKICTYTNVVWFLARNWRLNARSCNTRTLHDKSIKRSRYTPYLLYQCTCNIITFVTNSNNITIAGVRIIFGKRKSGGDSSHDDWPRDWVRQAVGYYTAAAAVLQNRPLDDDKRAGVKLYNTAEQNHGTFS